MPRYIDADWIAQRLDGWQDQLAKTYGENDEYVLCLGEVLMKIDDAPTADVRENVHAHWEERTMMNLSPNWKIIVCSACKQEPYYDDVHGYILSEFCPNCGARMDEGRE